MTFCGDFQRQCPAYDLDQLAGDLQPSRVYAGSPATQLPVLLWPEHCPGERDTHSWLPPLQGGRAGGIVQCHLLCQDRGELGLLLSLGGVMQLMVEQMGTCDRDAVSPKALVVSWSWTVGIQLSPAPWWILQPVLQEGMCTTDRHEEEQWTWGAVTLPQPPSYWENRIK